jgi:sugar phosphate permease
LFCSDLVSFLDRSNIGNAKTAGMDKALGINDAEYQWLLTIFYIPYILFEWLALMWKIVPPHIWAFVCVLLWGISSTLQSTAFNWSGMMVCRFFLAIAEAGYGPGLPYLLSFFYMRDEIGFRVGIFLSAAPFATCFAGALAYGITSGHASIANWRLLFLVEGIPSICLAFAAFFFLPDSPEKARFLTAEEKEVAKIRAVRQVGQEGESRVGGVNFKEIGEALIDPKNFLTAVSLPKCGENDKADMCYAAHVLLLQRRL